MKGILLIVSCLCWCIPLIAQKTRSFDFILTIDGNVVKEIYNPRILVENQGEKLTEISTSYYPGNFAIRDSDYTSIALLEDTTKLFFKFDYYEYSAKGDQKVYNYEIEIGKNWFQQLYLILKIYNTNKKQYRKKLIALPGREYTFELEYSGGSMLRVKKKV